MHKQKITITTLRELKQQGKKISMLTAYDYPTAKMVDEMGVEMILVGDSLGMVVLGYDSTLPVTMEEMLHHTKAVMRGVTNTLVVADMPFMSYQISKEQALANAGRFVQEAGAPTIKLEGGREMAETIQFIVRAGIPVMGHLGLTPQMVNQFGGFKAQGKTGEAAKHLLEDAKILEAAGAYAIVLEAVPASLAKKISEEISIPTIGIGAGPDCDGQVLVTNDLLGLYEKFTPKFVKQYSKLHVQIKESIRSYQEEVEKGIFPAAEHSFDLEPEELKKI